MSRSRSSLLLVHAGWFFAVPALAWADCAAMNNLPMGTEGTLGYDSQTKQVYLCNGTAWAMLGN